MPDPIPKFVSTFPTKELFISTLVRDIPLARAILDLVDNCVDGATRLRPKGNFEKLWIRINANPTSFRIEDNCGGIPLDIAINYAFRFGRPAGMQETPHSVGQFGVGMKRALFKLGNVFTVDSSAEHSHFRLRVDVGHWKDKKDKSGGDDWGFELNDAEYREIPAQETGTKIEVIELYPGVAHEFGLANFQSRLYDELATAHEHSIEKGLAIYLNETRVTSNPPRLLVSKAIRPAYLHFSINGQATTKVNVRLFAGVTGEERTEFAAAGWYVFCNNRLVLRADQSSTTGWEDIKFHPRFNRFRGYAFFDCEDSSRLPWNTMKTGVDTDSSVYQFARLRMITSMQPVLAFLNSLARETNLADPVRPLYTAITQATMVDLFKVPPNKTFVAPEPQKKTRMKPKNVWIRYQRPKSQFDRVKEVLKATTQGEVGERTFDYFYKHECMD